MKKIKILVIICIILIGILAIKVFVSNKDTGLYSKEDIINLLEKGEKYNNYYCKYNFFEDNNEEIVRYVKNEKQRVIGKDLIVYIDSKHNKKLVLKPSTKTGVEMKLDSKASLESIDNYLSVYFDELKDNENIFKFKGREKINDFECIIVELTFDKDKGYNYNKRRILIDTKTGLVVKTVFYDVNDNILYTVDYNLKLDSVSDSDVEIPNLNEFNITNIE